MSIKYYTTQYVVALFHLAKLFPKEQIWEMRAWERKPLELGKLYLHENINRLKLLLHIPKTSNVFTL